MNETKLDTSLLFRKMDALQREVWNLSSQLLDGFVSISEFELLTGLGKKIILEACQSGRLKSTQDKPGGKWFILKSEANRLLQEASDNLDEDIQLNGKRWSPAQYKRIIKKKLEEA